MSQIVRYVVTLSVSDETYDKLMEDLDTDRKVRGGLAAATAPYDEDGEPLVELDG